MKWVNNKLYENKISTLTAGSAIEGVQLRHLEQNRDARGSFTEVFQDHWQGMRRPCQWSIVHSVHNSFRGCHLHKRHDEYFCLLQGEVSLGLRDERLGSATCGNWQLYSLYGDDLAALIFPASVIHGWYFHTDSLHLQSVSESYRTYGEDDNLGVHWTDPALGIPWPFDSPILAARASRFGSLAELKEKILSCSSTKNR